jgi:hypothetical protein
MGGFHKGCINNHRQLCIDPIGHRAAHIRSI